MGIHRQMPDALRRLHPRYRTPWIGILVFSGAAIVLILPGQETLLGSIYSFGALLSFTIAHASVARLRAKRPDVERPYRGPGNVRIRGYDAPLFALVGGGFTAIAFVVIVVLNPEVAAIGAGWLLVGIVVYALYRRRQGLDLTSTHKVAIPQPVVDHEAEYDSVLVHFGDGGYDEQMLATAIKLAARKRRGIHVLVTITVPNALEIDAPMPDEEAAADSIIEQAKLQGGGRVSGPLGEGPRRPGGAADHRGGAGHARGRGRDDAAAADRRHVGVRQDGRDGAGRAAVPRDHRVAPAGARRAGARARAGDGRRREPDHRCSSPA